MQFQNATFSKRGQLKIQEMAFVLVAIFIFLVMAGLFFAVMWFSNIKGNAQELKDESARQLVKVIASSPEFIWPGCAGCIDLDKVNSIKENKKYIQLWGLDYLAVERVNPKFSQSECSKGVYPLCNKITLINSSAFFGTPSWAFVSLCRFENDKGGYTKCELGKIYASAKQAK